MKKLNDYLADHTVFSHINEPHINLIASQLDVMLKIRHGDRDLGKLVTSFVASDDTVSSNDETMIAQLLYAEHKDKWDKLFKFIDAELVPWEQNHTLTKVTYGKIVEDTASGADTTTRSDDIAGFDSTGFVDDSQRETVTEYGRGDTSEQSGTDEIEVTGESAQAETLVDYTMQFWNKWGLFKTILGDAAHSLCLPLISMEDK